ncbi:MAG TPA: nuclear transport factor 2 family protein [Acidimicrobiales bacterium]|nr:nuclear transport factor 2 family protein [Acidimicrobiales bacterium]
MTSSGPSYAEVVEGVRAALAAYAHALDDGRTDDVVAMFCPDGVLDTGRGTIEGHDALRAAFAKWVPQVPQRHLVLNTHVREWSSDVAAAVSDVVFLARPDDTWSVQLVGRYEDLLHRSDDTGSWRFHRRHAVFA